MLIWNDGRFTTSNCVVGRIATLTTEYVSSGTYKAHINTGTGNYTLKASFSSQEAAQVAAVLFIKKLIREASELFAENAEAPPVDVLPPA